MLEKVVRQAIAEVLKGGDGYVATLKADDGSWIQVLFNDPGWMLTFQPRAERMGEVRAWAGSSPLEVEEQPDDWVQGTIERSTPDEVVDLLVEFF